jgi:hypothetical protein
MTKLTDAIKTFVKKGRIEVEAPDDWPEGTQVVVEPIMHATSLGLSEEDWPSTPDEIARHLALMDQIEPLVLTSDEEAEWVASREARKQLEKARFAERAEQLRGIWESISWSLRLRFRWATARL